MPTVYKNIRTISFQVLSMISKVPFMSYTAHTSDIGVVGTVWMHIIKGGKSVQDIYSDSQCYYLYS